MRTYPIIFSQGDPRWANTQLGTAKGATIGLYGCLVTCWEMKANYYGHKITPPQLNSILVQKGLYVKDDLISSDQDLPIVFPDITYVNTYDFTNVLADLELLKQLSLDDTLTVTLMLDFDHNPADGIQTHFVELKSYDGISLIIYDPWDGTEKDFSQSYGNNPALTIQKFAVYKGVPANPSVVVDQDTIPIGKKDFENLRTKSSNFDDVSAAFGLKSDAELDPIAGKKLAEVYKTLIIENENLKKELQIAASKPTQPLTGPTSSPSTQTDGQLPLTPMIDGTTTSTVFPKVPETPKAPGSLTGQSKTGQKNIPSSLIGKIIFLLTH